MSLPTLVFSSDDRLIPGLQRENFRVLDNGQPQKFTLDTTESPVTVVFVVQVNQDVRDYLPFVAKVGSVVETLLTGESGEAALITYSDEISVVKPFGHGGDFASALRSMKPAGRDARLRDASWRALGLLRERPPNRARFLVLVGQPHDSGSVTSLSDLEAATDAENVTVFAITLPEFGKKFVSDNFWLEGPASAAERGGFKAGVNLGKLISVLEHAGGATAGTDPFSELTTATGGAQFHVRKQDELEHALTAIGFDAHSAYQLSYTPNSSDLGYHAIKVEVDVPGARVLSRPGYRRAD